MKLQERRYQAVTQVNVLSPVIFNIIEVDAVISSGRRNEGRRKGEPITALSGSKAMAWYEKYGRELGRSTALLGVRPEYCETSLLKARIARRCGGSRTDW